MSAYETISAQELHLIDEAGFGVSLIQSPGGRRKCIGVQIHQNAPNEPQGTPQTYWFMAVGPFSPNQLARFQFGFYCSDYRLRTCASAKPYIMACVLSRMAELAAAADGDEGIGAVEHEDYCRNVLDADFVETDFREFCNRDYKAQLDAEEAFKRECRRRY